MPAMLKYFIWAVVACGLIFIAISAFWFLLIIFGLILLCRFVALKLFRKGGTSDRDRVFGPISNVFVYRFREKSSEYTTVIDADDMEKEYKIPKIK